MQEQGPPGWAGKGAGGPQGGILAFKKQGEVLKVAKRGSAQSCAHHKEKNERKIIGKKKKNRKHKEKNRKTVNYRIIYEFCALVLGYLRLMM